MAENFQSRGIGSDGVACFVCGKMPAFFQPNIAAFVDDKAAGERVVSMFAAERSGVRLDYRDFEPNWVQVKVGACTTHLPNLEYLDRSVRPVGAITPRVIRDALKVNALGREP